MKITLAMLREKNACTEGMVWVKKNLPDGAEYRKFIEKLESDGKEEWARWLIDRFEVLVLAESWRIEALLAPLKDKKATDGKVDTGDSAQIGSSGDYAKIGSSGDSAKIGSSGDYAQIGSSGDSAKIGSSGYYAQIGSSGDYAQIGSSGDSAKIGSSGYYAKIGSSGYYAQIGSSGDSAKIKACGKNSTIAAAGYGTIAKVGENGCIALAWWDPKAKRPRMTVGYAGEDGIEAEKWYRADETGNLVAVSGVEE